MAIGTTDIGIVGGATYDGLYKEMGKGNTGTNYSLYAVRNGTNDIDVSTYAAANANQTQMGSYKNYDHMNLTFRYNTNQTFDNDTYDDLNSTGFGANVAFTNSATQGTNWWEFNGSSNYGYFSAVNSGASYKQGTSGNMVIAWWFHPGDNSAGQTVVLGNNVPLGSVSAYQGYRFDINGSAIRCIRGDGTGAASSDRRTFASVDFIAQEEWNFIAFQGAYNNTTLNTSNNYFWTWNQTGGWQNGISFLSGTGGNLSYSASTTSEYLALSSYNNGSRYYNGYIGGIYVFDQTMTQTDIETLKDNTQSTYGL